MMPQSSTATIRSTETRPVSTSTSTTHAMHAEPVRRQLRERRRVTLPVGLEACGQGDRAVRLHGERDRVEVARARESLVRRDLGGPASLLDEGTEPDAEVASFPAQAPL